jgi:hypothetical protein
MTDEPKNGQRPWEDRVKSYNRPGPTPREEMWAVIAEALESSEALQQEPTPETAPRSSTTHLRFPRRAAWLRPGLAAAAILVLGIGIGREFGPGATEAPEGGPVAEVAGVEGRMRVPDFQTVAADYLEDTEAFMTLLRADAREGQLNGDMGSWARALLLQTRFLMETERDPDPAVRRLLEDVELILVEVARVPADDETRATEELKWIDEGMETQDLLPRLRAVTPVGAGMAGT